MSATTWRGDDEPRITARVRRWYRLRVAQWLADVEAKHKGRIPAELTESLAEWFNDRLEAFLCWTPEEEYRGAHYSAGAWRLDFEAMGKAMRAARADILRDTQRRTYAALGPITDATVDQALARLHSDAPLVKEPSSWELYPDHTAALPFFRMRNRVERNLPKMCRTCGLEFRPAGGYVRCPDCRAAARRNRGGDATMQSP